MRKLLLVITVLLVSSTAFAQYYSYGWEANPSIRDFMETYSAELSALSVAAVLAMAVRLFFTSKRAGPFGENPQGVNALTVAIFLAMFVGLYTWGVDASAYIGLLMMFAFLAINFKIFQEVRGDNEGFSYGFLAIACFTKAYIAAQMGQGFMTMLLIVVAVIGAIKAASGMNLFNKGPVGDRYTTTPYTTTPRTPRTPYTDEERRDRKAEKDIPRKSDGSVDWDKITPEDLFSGKFLTEDNVEEYLKHIIDQELKMKQYIYNCLNFDLKFDVDTPKKFPTIKETHEKIEPYIIKIRNGGILDNDEKERLKALFNHDFIAWSNIGQTVRNYPSMLSSYLMKGGGWTRIIKKLNKRLKKASWTGSAIRPELMKLKGWAKSTQELKYEEKELFNNLLHGSLMWDNKKLKTGVRKAWGTSKLKDYRVKLIDKDPIKLISEDDDHSFLWETRFLAWAISDFKKYIRKELGKLPPGEVKDTTEKVVEDKEKEEQKDKSEKMKRLEERKKKYENLLKYYNTPEFNDELKKLTGGST